MVTLQKLELEAFQIENPQSDSPPVADQTNGAYSTKADKYPDLYPVVLQLNKMMQADAVAALYGIISSTIISIVCSHREYGWPRAMKLVSH